MADQYVQISPDNPTGKKIQVYENTVSAETVQAQAMVPVDETGVPIDIATDATLTDGTQQSRITDGTNFANVKAGSTAAQASDKALVVAVSPNNTVAVTQSGTWTIQPGNTANSTAWLVTGTGGVFPASQSGTWDINNIAGSISLPTGASTEASLVKLTVAQGAALGTNTQAMVGGSVTTAAPTYTNGQISPLNLNTAGGLRVDGSGVTQPVSGTVTANVGTTNGLALDATLTGGTQQTKLVDTGGSAVASITATNGTIGNGLQVITGKYNSALPTLTNGNVAFPQLNINGMQLVDGNVITDTGVVTAGTTRMLVVGGRDAGNQGRPLFTETDGVLRVVPRSNNLTWHANSTINSSSSVILSNMQSRDVCLLVNMTGSASGGTPTLFFQMDEIDPSNQTTVISGNSVRGPTITGATTHMIFFKCNSNFMRLSWTVGGSTPSFTGVNTSLISKIGDHSISLGNSANKTNKGTPGTLTSSATTGDQVISTYTVTTGRTFYLQQVDVTALLDTYAATATDFGTVSIETPSGTKVWTQRIYHAGAASPIIVRFAEPLPVPSAAVVRVVCTPAAATAFKWYANIIGYEV